MKKHKMVLDTEKPLITAVVKSWKEFRDFCDAEYRELVGKGIDWERSAFVLLWVDIAIEPRRLTYGLNVPIRIDSIPPNILDVVTFSGYIKAYIVECD